MSVAIPIPLLQNLPDVNVTPGVGVDEYALTYDHDTARFVLRAPFAGILATGATMGATAQAQAFTMGVVSPFLAPAADSTTAWQVRKADKTTAVVTVDTTNAMVGIGTTAPGAKFEVYTSDYLVTPLAKVKSTNVSGFAVLGIDRATTDRAAMTLYSTADSPEWYTGTAYNGGVANSKFSVGTGHNLSDSKLVIDTSGNVGIGTTSPATALHVVGAATITGGIRPAADSTTALQLQNAAGTSVLNVDTTNGYVGIGTTSPTLPVSVNKTGVQITGDLYAIARFDSDATRQHGIVLGYNNSTYNSIFMNNDSTNKGFEFWTYNTGNTWGPRVLIDRDGNVGVNDTAPAEALDVTGNINTTGVVKVDDVQVLSNRVIDARCADVANSGDATTDGLIDALRDAMIAHGLIAAA